MSIGWIDHSGHTYYYDDEGRMAHQWHMIGNKEYYFCEVTGIYVPGFEKVNGDAILS